ncbi:MAG: type II toxin-antitoxin system PemK/MazF family toxin [Oscillatoria sp. SIO1A7]|nr:type II toxin-antitoxin system PemK/MazF family toxin [Oscillatoria sp. SIO1A7]
MTLLKPLRGDIWLVDLNPARGHEQGGKRPCLVVSVDLFNSGPSELAVVLPVTTKDKGIPFHVEVNPSEGGLREKSFIKCEDIRSISTERFVQRWGAVSTTTMMMVEERLRILLSL